MKNTITILEDLNEEDDRVCFFSRQFGQTRIVIIPKEKYTLTETDTTYVLTKKLL